MRPSLIRDRVLLMDQFNAVNGAAALAAAVQQGQFAEGAFVYLKSRTAGENIGIGNVGQRLEHRITVAYWVRNLTDSTGDAAVDQALDISDALGLHLIGWTPDRRYAPLTYVSGSVLRYSPTVGLLWADEFKTSYHLQAVSR